ncbi:MAG TPA: winged helix DNA-binding domain-containing protein [Bacteroidales bacterium]
MKQPNIPALRLFNQQIAMPRFEKPDEILAWLGAIQGQDYQGAKWSVGLRLTKATDVDIENAFTGRKILRTWLMRGTLHMVAANDINWIRTLVAPKIITGNTRRYRELELDAETLVKSNDLLVKALQSKKQLNRKELLAFLEKNGMSTKGQRAAYMLQRASYDGLICQLNTVKNQPVYVLMDELPEGKKITDRNEAVVELTKRYFTSRGPATIQDFVWWSGLTVADTKFGLEANRSFLVEEKIGEQTYWLSAAKNSKTGNGNGVFLLPGFDEFLLGYKDRIASLQPQFSTKWCPGNNGMFYPFVVADGLVTGIWKREITKNSMVVRIEPFYKSVQLQNGMLAALAKNYSDFMGLSLASVDGPET